MTAASSAAKPVGFDAGLTTTLHRARAALSQLLARCACGLRPYESAALLTMILLMKAAGEAWYVRVPVTALCICAVLQRALMRSAYVWLALSALLAAGNQHDWFIIDNHRHLIAYWCLANYVAREASDPRAVLAVSARLLIGLCFLFATFWKLVSPDYLNGAFFHYELLTDARFANIAGSLTALSPELALRNTRALHALTAFDSTRSQVTLHTAPGVIILAWCMTYWTIAIEALLALLFLWPERRWTYAARNLCLLLFLISTYSNAPVLGFGWVLCVMGMAQCRRRDAGLCALYLFAFVAIWSYGIPWSGLALSAFDVRLPLAR